MQISVVVATYNGEKYIRKQLDSIMKQTIMPDEVLISDDCSMDRTWEILQEYEKKYSAVIKVFRNEKNVGYAANFWSLLRLAKGKIIFLSDQDDIWYTSKIEKMSKMINENHNILALSSSYELIDEQDRRYRDIRNVPFKNNQRLKKITWEEFVIHPKYPGMTMAICKSLLDKISLIELKEVPAHDWLLNHYASLYEGMYLWDVILSQYRQHQENVVGSSASNRNVNCKDRRIRTITDMQKLLELLLDIFQKENIDSTKIGYIKHINEVCKNRINLIKEDHYIKLIFCDLKNHSYLTVRSILGDAYTGIKMVIEKRK